MCSLFTGVQTCSLPVGDPVVCPCPADARVGGEGCAARPDLGLCAGGAGRGGRYSHAEPDRGRNARRDDAYRRDQHRQNRSRDPGRISPRIVTAARSIRSEEHTSELQSLMRISYAVFCLKKKTKKKSTKQTHETTTQHK